MFFAKAFLFFSSRYSDYITFHSTLNSDSDADTGENTIRKCSAQVLGVRDGIVASVLLSEDEVRGVGNEVDFVGAVRGELGDLADKVLVVEDLADVGTAATDVVSVRDGTTGTNHDVRVHRTTLKFV